MKIYHITAPLPGKIISVDVKIGDVVRVGDVVAVLEAMKMDNEIESEFEGQVVAVKVSEGDTIPAGAVILTIG
jgi:biotin carboxyl carrier protein